MARITVADLDLSRPEPFEYEAADGTVYVLAAPTDAPGETLLHFEELSIPDRVNALLGDQGAEFMRLPMYEIAAVLDLWAKHFGLESLLGSLPEGLASPL